MKDQYSMDKRYFYYNTRDLSERDRHNLILDYFAKARVLLNEDMECRSEAVKQTPTREKQEISRQMKRMRQSYDLIKLLDEAVESYKKGVIK